MSCVLRAVLCAARARARAAAGERVLRPYEFPTLELASEAAARGDEVEAVRDTEVEALNSLKLCE